MKGKRATEEREQRAQEAGGRSQPGQSNAA